MALDFHRSDNNEYLFGLTQQQYDCLTPIFETFRQWTGIEIDPYKDMKLTTDNCKTLLRVTDQYISQTDLNKDKKATIEILGFRGLIDHFMQKNVSLLLKGD
jgi:hypothetical protein